MKPRRLPALLLLLVLAFLPARPLTAAEARVAVAANFLQPARALAAAFREASGHELRLSHASTGMLYAQIRHGAPFDVFLAADRARPQRLVEDGLAVADSLFVYAFGRLVLWNPAADAFEDGERYLRGMPFERLAIANPDTAPYGRAARETLERLGLWDRLRPRLVIGNSIAQAFQFVATANAEAGLVAASQLRGSKRREGSLWPVPETYHRPIAQAAVLLNRGRGNPAAREFLAFLQGSRARGIIEGWGYSTEKN